MATSGNYINTQNCENGFQMENKSQKILHHLHVGRPVAMGGPRGAVPPLVIPECPPMREEEIVQWQ